MLSEAGLFPLLRDKLLRSAESKVIYLLNDSKMAVIDNLTVEKKMLERKNRVAWLIAEAQEDPAIDESVVEQFFYAVSKEVEIYKYSGNSSFIQSYMDAQITQN